MNEWMPDNKLLAGLAAGLMSVLTWLGKRQVRRIDRLETTTVKKEDFDQLADTVRSEVTAIHDRMDRKFDEQTNRIFQMLRDKQ